MLSQLRVFKSCDHNLMHIFFLIAAPAESWDKDESWKGNESYIEALLPKPKDNQGCLQTYFTKMRS